LHQKNNRVSEINSEKNLPTGPSLSLSHESHGRIIATGPSATTKHPRFAGAVTVINCKGQVVAAGFWNSHVHILLPSLLHAEKLSSQQLTSQLEGMLTRWGFTTVFDIASVLNNTTLIRRRIESGEAKGPRILTVGDRFG
jgi:imidazolonepropionase-like amidohydrolase